MNLRRFSFLSISLFLVFVTACSVYKSTGRKNFESNVPGNVRAAQLSKGEISEDEMIHPSADTCWNQPAQDPLWHIDPHVSLSVSPLNNDEIQVCILDL